MQIQLKKLVQSSSKISHFIDSINNTPIQMKNWKMTANHASFWNQWWKKVSWCTTQQNRMLSLSSCICKSLIKQVFNRPRKLNIESVLLALLFICPCINRALGPWQWLRSLDFPSKGTFLEASSIKFISMYDVFTTGQFFCILTAMVIWLSSYNLFYMKESFVSQNATTVIEWSLTTCTLLM